MFKDHTVNPDRLRRHLVVGLCALGTGLGIAKYLAGRALVPAGHPTIGGRRAATETRPEGRAISNWLNEASAINSRNK